MFTIYKITNKIDGKIYIGQTSRTIYERFKEHCKCAFDYNMNLGFSRALRKYGKDNFNIDILEENICERQTANEKEKYFISLYNSTDRNIGYNSTPGGEGGNTYLTKTEKEMKEISQKISQKLSGENNGNHRVIYMFDTLTGKEIRFGSCLMCESYLKNLGYDTRRRIHMLNAKKNSIFGVQKRFEGRYIFRYEGDEYNRWTDFETNSGDICFKMININSGEVFFGISKKECLYHFGFIKNYFSGRIDNLCNKLKLKEKGYIVKKTEEYEYKKYMGE